MIDWTICGRGNLMLIPTDPEALRDVADLREAMEDMLCNGWSEIGPEEIGALTGGMIVAEDWERDDDGVLTHVGRVYWDVQYQVRDALERLQGGESVTLLAAT